MKIYFAAPVFSQVERQYNRRLAARLGELMQRSEIVLPQDFRAIGAKFNDPEHLPSIYKRCVESINAADVIIALLDGADVDSGVAFEVGYARAMDKLVLGVRTDYRQQQSKGVNVMLANGCSDVLCHYSFNEKLDDLAGFIVERLQKISKPGHFG